ncbi:MAG: DUF4258 domain-containing protein [Candidatus Brocadiia bacterium]|jgi:hypothetical protein
MKKRCYNQAVENDLREAVLTDHARKQMRRRQLNEASVRAVLSKPEQILPVRAGRVVAQAIADGFLVRVFVDVDRHPPEVVTVYRTRKIEKYRSQP